MVQTERCRTTYYDVLRRGFVPSRSRSMETSLEEKPFVLDSWIRGYRLINLNEQEENAVSV